MSFAFNQTPPKLAIDGSNSKPSTPKTPTRKSPRTPTSIEIRKSPRTPKSPKTTLFPEKSNLEIEQLLDQLQNTNKETVFVTVNNSILTQAQPRPTIKCPVKICKKMVYTRSGLKLHIRRKHPDVLVKEEKCPTCHRPY